MKKTLTLALALAATSVLAGPAAPINTVASHEDSIFDKIWKLPTIYKNDDSAFLNELRFVGKAQFDMYSIDSGAGADQDWIVRRLRAGLLARLMHSRLELHVEADLTPQSDPVYARLTDAYASWKFCDAAKLTLGKQSTKFTLDGSTSSNDLLTIDRNNLSNNLWFTQEYISGISLSGKINAWQYTAGFYSGGTDTKEFGNFDEGHFALLSLGYDFGKAIGAKKALLRADYVYNDRNAKSSATRSFENIGSLTFQLDEGKWGVSTDLSLGTGYGKQSDVFGLVIMPWYNITDKLQAVVRYTYLESEDPNGIRFGRYENVMSKGKGDEYQEWYAGLNYYVYGQKLKLQTGVTWADMQDSANDGGALHAWTWTTGLRVSW